MIGSTVSQYEITEEIGSGGMGVVYRAFDSKLQRHVALKFLPPELTADAEAKERFVQEARAAAALDHASICTIHEIGETGDSPEFGESRLFIAMAFYEGQTLDRRLEQGPIPVDEALSIATAIAKGLACAHAAGIVHRDIKPANIMLTDGGEVKILDFGIAKLAGRDNLTRLGSTVGTTAYMSPEQARGEEVDGRTDLWSLGVILYQMLAGRAPFEGAYEQAIIYSIVNKEPPELEDETEGVRAVTGRLLTKAAVGRYRDCDALLADLRRLGDGDDISPSRPKWWKYVGAALAIIVLVVGYRWLDHGEANRDQATGPAEPDVALDDSERIAVLPFSYRGSEENSWLGHGLMDLMNTNLSGTQNGYTVRADAVMLAIDQIDSSQTRPIGEAVAEFLEVNRYVQGEIVVIGDQVRISAALHDRSALQGEPIRGEAAGSMDDLYNMVDELAGNLLVGTSSLFDQRDAALALGTTNLKALKWFLEGQDRARTPTNRGALEAFENAVAEDSTFALAWYYVSIWKDEPPGANRAPIVRAIELSGDLPERDQAMMVGRLAQLDGEYERAAQIFLEILRVDPLDTYALAEMNNVLFDGNYHRGRSIYECVPYSQRLRKLVPDAGGNSGFRPILQAIDTADSAALAAHPPCDHVLTWVCTLSKLVQAYDEDPASTLNVDESVNWFDIKEFDQFRTDPVVSLQLTARNTLPPNPPFKRLTNWWQLAQLNTARGRFQAAQADLDSMIVAGEPFAVVYPGAVSAIDLEMRAFCAAMPFIDLGADQIDSLRSTLEAWDAERTADVDGFPYRGNNGRHGLTKLYLLGLLAAKASDFDRAAGYADELEALASQRPEGVAIMDLARGIRARVAFDRDDAEAALEIVEPISQSFQHWRWWPIYFAMTPEHHLHGEILYALGRYEEAYQWFYTARYSSKVLFNAIRFYYQARCLEAMGDDDAAVADYRTFMDLWQNSDLDQRRLVNDARQRSEDLGRNIEG